jgi:hypothetical protein
VDRAKIRGRISEDIHERQRSSLGIDEEDWYVHVGIMVAGPPDGRLCTSRGSTPFSSPPMPVPPLAPTPAKRAEDAVATVALRRARASMREHLEFPRQGPSKHA